MIDFTEIIDAWVRKSNPSETERLLSEERVTICTNGVYYKEIVKKQRWSAFCTECNCPLSGKIFSGKINPCRIGKWIEVDKKYDIYKEVKSKKTIL